MVEYYNIEAKNKDLGKYEFYIEAHEMPSNEVLPIIDKSYFPVTTATYMTEIDNTAPSARYSAKGVVPVDVIFAVGTCSQQSELENYTQNFKANLNNAGNSLDCLVTAVETVKGGFDMENADAETIFYQWEQYPDPNNYSLQSDASGKVIINAVYQWNGFQSQVRNPSNQFNQLFVESGSWDAGDFELSSKYAWHGCAVPSGFIFHWDKATDSAYVLEIGRDTSTSSWSREGFTLFKVKNMSAVIGRKNGTWLCEYSGTTTLKHTPSSTTTSGIGDDIKITMQGSNIKVYRNGAEVINYTDPSPILQGGVGLWAGCTVAFRDVQVAYDKTVKVSLGEAITDVKWRDNSVKFIVHVNDEMPMECETGNDSLFAYTISKLLGSNCYLVNLGNNANKWGMQELLSAITDIDSIPKGTFIQNAPITTALDETANYIIDIAKKYSKEAQWILINTNVVWDTVYKDYENDLPLNFGEHDGTGKWGDTEDSDLAQTFGISLTHLFQEDKINAEKWRFRHFYQFYDNSNVQEGYHNIYITEPPETFPNPGKYRINYKRKDNPFYQDVDLNNPFNEYRKWSTDYDYRVVATP